MANSYDKGDLVRISGTFTNSAGTNTDPSVVRCKYQDPSGNETSLLYGTDAALVKSATGIYYVDVDADESGHWYYRFYSTGTGQGAGENDFHVRISEF